MDGTVATFRSTLLLERLLIRFVTATSKDPVGARCACCAATYAIVVAILGSCIHAEVP